MVDIRHYLPEIEDPKSIGVTEAVYYPVLENILEENDTLEDRIAAIHRHIHDMLRNQIMDISADSSNSVLKCVIFFQKSRTWKSLVLQS